MSNYRRGFTLIELLLGLTLFSIVAGIIFSAFSGGLQLNRRANQQNDIYRQARWSLELIKKDLENMVYYNFANSYKEDRSAFEGMEDQMNLILPTEEGLKVIKYYLTSQENDRINKEIVRQATKKNVRVVTGAISEERTFFLVREVIDFASFLADEHKRGALEVIGTAIKNDGLKLFYYDHESEINEGWVNQWNQPYFPLIVRAELKFLDIDKEINMLSLAKKILIPVNNYKLISNDGI